MLENKPRSCYSFRVDAEDSAFLTVLVLSYVSLRVAIFIREELGETKKYAVVKLSLDRGACGRWEACAIWCDMPVCGTEVREI